MVAFHMKLSGLKTEGLSPIIISTIAQYNHEPSSTFSLLPSAYSGPTASSELFESCEKQHHNGRSFNPLLSFHKLLSLIYI